VLRLVTIGDSIPFAQGDCAYCASFTSLWAADIQKSTGIVVQALNQSSHDGLTDQGLLERIRTRQPMRDAVAAADIVVVSIGHNSTPWNREDDTCDGSVDFVWANYTAACIDAATKDHEANLNAILDEVLALRHGAPTAIRVDVDYNDIIGDSTLPPGGDDVSRKVIDAFAAATCRAAEAHGAVCVDVYHAFNGADGSHDAGNLLAGDHTHPSALGQSTIADLLIASGLSPLTIGG
jgi:lysophospholipase L1-like esterase